MPVVDRAFETVTFILLNRMNKKTNIFCLCFFRHLHILSFSFPFVCIYLNIWNGLIPSRSELLSWLGGAPSASIHTHHFRILNIWTLFAWIVIALCNSMMIMASIEFPLKIKKVWNRTEWKRLHVKIGAYVSHIRLPMKNVARVSNSLSAHQQ